jgi:hypothetical protein
VEARTAGPGLRPLGVGEILDMAFRLYRVRFRTLSLCVLVPVVPFTIVQVVAMALLSEDAFDPAADRGGAADGAELAGIGASALLTSLLSLLAVAACTRAVAAAYRGEDVEWAESIRFALRRFGPLVVALLATLVFAFAGFLALVIPGIYVVVRLAVVIPALLVEDLPASAALSRSWQLVGGRWWPAAGVLLVTVVLVSILAGLIQGVLVAPLLRGEEDELIGAVVTAVGQILANVVTLPLQAAVIAILYFDLRLRREGPSPAPAEAATGSFGGFAPPLPPDPDPR